MKKQVRKYRRELSDCVKEAKQILNKRYVTKEVKFLALQLWFSSSKLVEVEIRD
jgi:hypothetical protein